VNENFKIDFGLMDIDNKPSGPNGTLTIGGKTVIDRSVVIICISFQHVYHFCLFEKNIGLNLVRLNKNGIRI
jgi:hypothetical protein